MGMTLSGHKRAVRGARARAMRRVGGISSYAVRRVAGLTHK